MLFEVPTRHVITGERNGKPVPVLYRIRVWMDPESDEPSVGYAFPQWARRHAKWAREDYARVEVEELFELPDEWVTMWAMAHLQDLLPASAHQEFAQLMRQLPDAQQAGAAEPAGPGLGGG